MARPDSASPVAAAISDITDLAELAREDERTRGAAPGPAQAPAVRRVMGTTTATLLVVASMVGTGVFTTTGLLLESIPSSPAVLLAWLLGGVIALFGALSYAELVAAMPRNGGEYQLLSRIFHPAVGFVAGWISLIVGFSAPIAAAAIAFGVYFQAVVPAADPVLSAVVLISALSMVHAARVTLGSGLQNIFSIAKVTVVAAFIIGGCLLGQPERLTEGSIPTLNALATPGFAIGLIYVSFAYSGWNGAAYIAGEIRNPQRALPRALALGTALVTLLYLGLNVVFLSAAPQSELAGAIDVGNVAAVSLFGVKAGHLLSGVISLLLVSSVSAMIMAGPRVYQAIGEDYRVFHFLRARSGNSGPIYAICLQAAAAFVMLFTSSFDQLLTYIGFTLSISAGLTVVGVFVLRRREPDMARPYRCWGYPLTPILFIALSCWMVVFTLVADPPVAIVGVATIAAGLVIYLLARRPGDCSNLDAPPSLD